jgi:hypothetical protein
MSKKLRHWLLVIAVDISYTFVVPRDRNLQKYMSTHKIFEDRGILVCAQTFAVPEL